MPDFTLKPTFPVSSVIDAASRNAALQQQARESGNQSLIAGLQSIGQIGQSLFDQKVRVAQALAGAHMMATQNPELLGDNQVTQTQQGPVTQNQTASYDPSTGTATPNRPPLDIRTIATAMYGMSPKDMFEHQIQTQAAKTAQEELALKQKTEPQRLAIEGQKSLAEIQNAQVMRKIQAMLANATIKNQAQERTQAAENSALEANKETAKHWLLHPVDAYNASKAISTAGQSATMPSFSTESDAQKANLPKGSIIMIGGKRVRVD